MILGIELIILLIKSKCKVAPLLIWTLAATSTRPHANPLSITATPTKRTDPTPASTPNLWLPYAESSSKMPNPQWLLPHP